MGRAAERSGPVRWAGQELDAEGTRAMRAAARSEFERSYTGERNYRMLTEIYAATRAEQQRRGAAGARGPR
jgi:hypothetical protein